MDNVLVYIDNVEDLEKLQEEHFKEVIINDITIDEKMLFMINENSKMEILCLRNCYIKECDELYNLNVKELDLTDSKIEDILFINNMDKIDTLILDNIKEIDLNDISIIKFLKVFSLSNVKILNQDKLFYLSNIEMLRIDGTNIKDLSILLSYDKLKYLVVDIKQVEDNNDIFKELVNKGIKVVDYRNNPVM